MERNRPDDATLAWYATGAAVFIYEICSRDGQLMSEGMDRAIEKRPILTRIAIGTVALHLMNYLPTTIDPLHYVAKLGNIKRSYPRKSSSSDVIS